MHLESAHIHITFKSHIDIKVLLSIFVSDDPEHTKKQNPTDFGFKMSNDNVQITHSCICWLPISAVYRHSPAKPRYDTHHDIEATISAVFDTSIYRHRDLTIRVSIQLSLYR